jgi:hypothetical protein
MLKRSESFAFLVSFCKKLMIRSRLNDASNTVYSCFVAGSAVEVTNGIRQTYT